MPNLKDGWFADRAPGGGKVIYTTAGNPATATPVGGLVGVGASGTPPAGFPALPEPGTPIPPAGSNSTVRNSFFAAFRNATGFDSHTYLTGFPSGFTESAAWSLSTFINMGVNNVVGFNPNPAATNNPSATTAAVPLITASVNNSEYVDDHDGGNLDPGRVGVALAEIDGMANGFYSAAFSGDTLFGLDGGSGAPVFRALAYPSDTSLPTGWAHLMLAARITPFSTSTGSPPSFSWGQNLHLVAYINDTEIINGTHVVPIDDTGLTVRLAGFNFDSLQGDNPSPPTDVRAIGRTSDAADGSWLYAALAEFWEMPGLFVDWSIAANRYKFHTVDDNFGGANAIYAPVDIGPTGARPFGRTPRFYLTGGPSQFVFNRANRSTLTVNGHALVAIDDPPGG